MLTVKQVERWKLWMWWLNLANRSSDDEGVMSCWNLKKLTSVHQSRFRRADVGPKLHFATNRWLLHFLLPDNISRLDIREGKKEYHPLIIMITTISDDDADTRSFEENPRGDEGWSLCVFASHHHCHRQNTEVRKVRQEMGCFVSSQLWDISSKLIVRRVHYIWECRCASMKHFLYKYPSHSSHLLHFY